MTAQKVAARTTPNTAQPNMKMPGLTIRTPTQYEGSETQNRRYPDTNKYALVFAASEPQVHREQKRRGRGKYEAKFCHLQLVHNQVPLEECVIEFPLMNLSIIKCLVVF